MVADACLEIISAETDGKGGRDRVRLRSYGRFSATADTLRESIPNGSSPARITIDIVDTFDGETDFRPPIPFTVAHVALGIEVLEDPRELGLPNAKTLDTSGDVDRTICAAIGGIEEHAEHLEPHSFLAPPLKLEPPIL
jgi:hypothetical protein